MHSATDSVTAVQVRKRLLFGSLAVAAVGSVAVGWALARSGATVATDTGSGDVTFAPPQIETNADVEGSSLPAATVQLLDGTAFDTRSLVGTPVVINIWGSTCGPCKEELPAFAAVHRRFGDDVRFVGIDFLGPTQREEAFARDRGVQYELFYDSDGAFITAIGAAAFPVTLFVDSDGTIVRQTGRLTEAELTRYVGELR